MLFANNKFLTSFDSLCYFEEFSVNWWSNNRNVNSRQTSVLTDLEIGFFHLCICRSHRLRSAVTLEAHL